MREYEVIVQTVAILADVRRQETRRTQFDPGKTAVVKRQAARAIADGEGNA